MKNLTQLLFTLFCLCLPTMLQAQDRDDSKYLAGAVPEVDGKWYSPTNSMSTSRHVSG